MRGTSKALLALLLILFGLELLILAPKKVGLNKNEPSIENETGENVDQVMTGVHLVEAREEEKEWELWANQALGVRGEGLWKLKNVKATFFGKGTQFFVKGHRGSVDIKTKDMFIEGDVETRSSNGYEFKTNSMKYSSKKRLLETKDPIEMKGPKDQLGRLFLKGQGMLVDMVSSDMKVLKEVQAQKKIKKGKIVYITSQSSRFSAVTHKAQFIDDVIIDIDTMRVTGKKANLMYNTNKKMVSSVEVEGDVKVSDVDKWATSAKVSVFLDQDKYVFEGRPRVVQNEDELVGEKIVFLNGGKKVKVFRGKAKMDKKNLEKMN